MTAGLESRDAEAPYVTNMESDYEYDSEGISANEL
jgi:hypothetical protein